MDEDPGTVTALYSPLDRYVHLRSWLLHGNLAHYILCLLPLDIAISFGTAFFPSFTLISVGGIVPALGEN